MDDRTADSAFAALRWASVALGAALLILVLRGAVATPESGWLLVIALGAGRAAGHTAKVLGAPAALGQLTAGVLLGPSLIEVLRGSFVGVPDGPALLGPAELALSEPFRIGALALIAGWIGRRLRPRTLRKSGAGIVAMFAGQLIAAAAITGVVVLAARQGWLPAAWLDEALRSGDAGGLALALLGTSLVLTASALHDQRSDGPVTRTILSIAVLGELLVLGVLVIWTSVVGDAWSSLAIAHPGEPARLAESALIGIFGGGLALGIARQTEGGALWSAVMLLLMAVLTSQIGHSVVLASLFAGIVLSPTAPVGGRDALDAAAGLAFSVVLTLAGASLPLDAVLGPELAIASVVVLIRLGLLFGGAVTGARLVGAPPAIVRYGWTGLVASALPTAGLMAWVGLDASAHPQLTAVLWGVAAIDGLLGPLAVSLAVRFADELPTARVSIEAAPAVLREGPWVDPDLLPPGRLLDHAVELEEDLRGAARDLAAGPFATLRTELREYVDALRRITIRHHRQLGAVVAEPMDRRDEGLRRARTQLAERWRGQVLDRAARLERHPWHPNSLVHQLDRMAMQHPEEVVAPMPARAPGSALDEAFRDLTGWLVGGPRVERVVPLRDLLRYHLSGQLPLRLEAVAALLIDAELSLVSQVRALFRRTLDAYQDVLKQAEPEAALEAVRRELEADFRSALEEVDASIEQLVQRVEIVFHQVLDEITADLAEIGSPELPASDRSPARAKDARERGLKLLGDDLTRARHDCRTRLSALALDIELTGLELQVEVSIADHGAQLARLVRGRGTTQLQRVAEAAQAMLARVDERLKAHHSGRELAEQLNEEAADFSHIAIDAARQADELREQLADEQIILPLHDSLLRAGHTLTERYEVPLGQGERGSWRLPTPLASQEVAFRDVVLAYLDTSVTRDMLALTQRYGLKLHRAVEAIEELERAVTFSIELTAAEFAEAGEEAPNPVDRETLCHALHETVHQALTTLTTLRTESSAWFADVDERIRASVVDGLESFRVQITDGRFAELSHETPDARASRVVVRQAKPDGPAPSRLRAWLGDRLGEQHMARLHHELGLMAEAPLDTRLTPEHFARPAPHTRIPVVYRRLFSERALNAGELLAGRRVQAERIRHALLDERPDHLRSVALIGPPGAGHRAIVRAALRSLRSKGQHEFAPEGPVGVDEVEGWFDRSRHGHVHVLSNLHWLFSLQAGGFEPLRRLLDGISADSGRNAWLATFDEPTWRYASAVVPLARVFPVRVELRPLNEAELREAMLARHAMSGFRLVFSGIDPDAPEIDQQRHRALWFHSFHTATGGIAREALHTWVAAIDEVDVQRGLVRMGEVPAVRTIALRQLTDETVLVLRVAVRRGWIDDVTYTRLFQVDPTQARAHLAHLAHWGLLAAHAGRYAVPTHLHRGLLTTLRERGWA
jgi:Kef-type K+ transport system membrane component KefB